MASIRRFNKQSHRDAISTLCFGAAGIAEGSVTAGSAQVANAIDYSIDGILYSKAAEDNIVLTGSTILDGYAAMILVAINAAGAVSFVSGTPALIGQPLYLPDPVDGTCVIGAIKVATVGADFVPGTTDLSAAEVTDTYFDLSCDPGSAF